MDIGHPEVSQDLSTLKTGDMMAHIVKIIDQNFKLPEADQYVANKAAIESLHQGLVGTYKSIGFSEGAASQKAIEGLRVPFRALDNCDPHDPNTYERGISDLRSLHDKHGLYSDLLERHLPKPTV